MQESPIDVRDYSTMSPYNDEELRSAIQRMINEPHLIKMMKWVYPGLRKAEIIQMFEEVLSVDQFQEEISAPAVKVITQMTTSGVTLTNESSIEPDQAYLFVSNHRDIILDSALLNVSLIERGIPTTEIAIGDNLLRLPLVRDIVRCNKNFIVSRDVNAKEMFYYSLRMSNYIKHTITEKKTSIWIAQREGRAKDGDDRTQVGLVKMLSLSTKTDLKNYFRELKVVPVAISYEYDPCDLLKTQEFLNKRANPDFKKTFEEDVQHMLLGLKGYKGAVNFDFSPPFMAELDAFDAIPSSKKQLELLAEMIDQRIHQYYKLRPINYVAQDLLTQTDSFRNYYSTEDLEKGSAYFDQRFKLLTDDGEGLGREYLLKMYANPLLNQLAADV